VADLGEQLLGQWKQTVQHYHLLLELIGLCHQVAGKLRLEGNRTAAGELLVNAGKSSF